MDNGWMVALSVFLAFVLGAVFSCLELVTSRYWSTATFVLRSWPLYVYGVSYGILAALAAMAFDFHLFSSDLLQNAVKPGSEQVATGAGLAAFLGTIWGHAIACGLATKSVIQLNLFTFAPNSTTSYPIGLQTITLVFEPRLQRAILFDESGEVRAFVQKRIGANGKAAQPLPTIRAEIAASIPPTLPIEERKGFLIGIEEAVSPEEALEKFLRFVGRRAFSRVF